MLGKQKFTCMCRMTRATFSMKKYFRFLCKESFSEGVPFKTFPRFFSKFPLEYVDEIMYAYSLSL